MSNFILRLLSSAILAPFIIFSIYSANWVFFVLLFFIFCVGLFEILKLNNFIIKVIIFIIFISFLFICLEFGRTNYGKTTLLFILFLTWSSDLGGYVFGKLIGGKKIKIISPKKTYSGFFGSFLFCQFFFFLCSSFDLGVNFINERNILKNEFVIFLFTLNVILGDLLFSYFKRVCGIKDFSNLLPGHGGLFDRIDGMIILTIFIFLFFYL